MSSGNITCTKTDDKTCLAPGVSTAGANLNFEHGRGLMSYIIQGLLLIGLAAAVTPSFDDENLPVYYNSTMELSSAANLSSAVDYAYQSYLNGTDPSDILVHVSATNTIVTNFTFPANTTEFSKRFDAGNAPLGTWFHQWQVTQQGFWDQRWYPASGCQYTGYSSTSLKYTQGWSQKTSWSVDAGFNWDIGKGFALNIGATLTKEFGQSGSWEITVPADSVGQTWTQKRMVWQQQQRQKCVRRHYGSNGLHCDSWGPYIHGDIPDTQTYNLGVSIGSDHVQC